MLDLTGSTNHGPPSSGSLARRRAWGLLPADFRCASGLIQEVDR